MKKNLEDGNSPSQDKEAEGTKIIPEYEMKMICINKSNINNFHFYEETQRDIRKSQVNKQLTALKNEKHFDVVLAVDTQKNGYGIIDGNHRINAIKTWFNESNGVKREIDMWCMVYPKLTIEQRRAVYRKLNIGIKQSTADFISAYRQTIPMFETITNSGLLPCHIYGNNNNMKFKHFVGAYHCAKRPGKVFSGGFMGKPYEFVEMARTLTYKDVKVIKEFWDMYTKAFSIDLDVNAVSSYKELKTTIFYAMFRLWYINKNRFSEREIISRLRANAVRKVIEENYQHGGRANCVSFLNILKNAINKNYTRKPKKQFGTEPFKGE